MRNRSCLPLGTEHRHTLVCCWDPSRNSPPPSRASHAAARCSPQAIQTSGRQPLAPKCFASNPVSLSRFSSVPDGVRYPHAAWHRRYCRCTRRCVPRRVCSRVSSRPPEKTPPRRSHRFQERNQALLQHHPCAVQPHFHCTGVNSQRLRRFLHVQFFQVSQRKNFPVNVRQLCHRNPQCFPQFLAFQCLERNLAPVRQRRRSVLALLPLNLLINRFLCCAFCLSQPFPAFIDGNGRRPRAELRLSSKRGKVPVCADDRLLGPILVFRLILSDRKQSQLHHPLERPYTLVKQSFLSPEASPDRPDFVSSRT